MQRHGGLAAYSGRHFVDICGSILSALFVLGRKTASLARQRQVMSYQSFIRYTFLPHWPVRRAFSRNRYALFYRIPCSIIPKQCLLCTASREWYLKRIFNRLAVSPVGQTRRHFVSTCYFEVCLLTSFNSNISIPFRFVYFVNLFALHPQKKK